MRNRILEHGPKIRRIVLITTLILVILFFLRGLRDPFNIPKLAILFTGTALVLAIRLAELLQGADRKGLTRFALPAAFISIPMVISWMFSPNDEVSLLGEYGRFQGLVPYLVTILFAALVADAFVDAPRSLAWGIVSAGSFVGGYSIMQGLGLDPFSWSLGSGQTFQGLSSTGNPNFTGGILGMALPVGLALWISERQRWPKVLPWCGAMMVGGWLYAQSQGGWAAGIGGLAVTAGILFGHKIPFGRLAGWAIAFGVLTVSVAIAAVGNAFSLQWVPLTARLRGEWWVMAVNMGLDRPVVGHGPDTFASTGMLYRTLREGLLDRSVLPDTPHSVFLWFFACAGIIGAVGFVALGVWVVMKSRSIDADNVFGAAFVGGSVAYFIQAVVSIDQLPLRVMGWTLFGGVAASLVMTAVPIKGKAAPKNSSRNGPKRKKKTQTSTPLRWAPVFVLLALLVGAVVFYSADLVLADYKMRRGSDLSRAGEWEQAVETMESALAIRNDVQYRVQFANHMTDAGRATQDPVYFGRAEELLSFVDRFPDIRATTSRAVMYEAWMDIDPSKAPDAEAGYRRAYEIDPYNPLSVTNLSDFLVRLQKTDEAVEVISELVEIVEDPPPGVEGVFGDVYGSWAMALAADGQVQKAREALAKTIEVAPEDRHIAFVQQLLQQAES